MDAVSFDDKNYPPLLKEIPLPPKKLYYRGGFGNDSRPHIAIVGTRNATLAGREIAKRFAKELAARGVVIVSGLALGIDTAAHEGALEGKGKTIAVLGNGLDWVYPRQNEKLSQKILETGGALVSEYPEGTESFPLHFLERNRIVSGLSLGIVVVEAPEKSGALNTAAHALEQNREVFVVPGPINHENYSGSYALLRAGARLVTKPQDVLEDLGMTEKAAANQQVLSSVLNMTDDQETIFRTVKDAGEALSVDRIREITQLEIPKINRALTHLVIKGLIKERVGLYGFY